MNFNYVTLALCRFFEDVPNGEYHPVCVRKALRISRTDWRYYAKAKLYPANSEVRNSLASLGVKVKTKGKPWRTSDGVMITSRFIKRRKCNVAQATAGG